MHLNGTPLLRKVGCLMLCTGTDCGYSGVRGDIFSISVSSTLIMMGSQVTDSHVGTFIEAQYIYCDVFVQALKH